MEPCSYKGWGNSLTIGCVWSLLEMVSGIFPIVVIGCVWSFSFKVTGIFPTIEYTPICILPTSWDCWGFYPFGQWVRRLGTCLILTSHGEQYLLQVSGCRCSITWFLRIKLGRSMNNRMCLILTKNGKFYLLYCHYRVSLILTTHEKLYLSPTLKSRDWISGSFFLK